MVQFISADNLSAIIKSEKIPRKDYLVVDVRDNDWAGGNIKNSHHSPSRKFSNNVESLVQDTKHIPTIIFHCALSQVRGPKTARIYEEARARLMKDQTDISPEVLVLRGGFTQFQTIFKDDSDLVENWDANIWDSDFGVEFI